MLLYTQMKAKLRNIILTVSVVIHSLMVNVLHATCVCSSHYNPPWYFGSEGFHAPVKKIVGPFQADLPRSFAR